MKQTHGEGLMATGGYSLIAEVPYTDNNTLKDDEIQTLYYGLCNTLGHALQIQSFLDRQDSKIKTFVKPVSR
ncbi:hypothetical protein C6499_19130 [Candidatus Poribacteria bacterium]|nr:MAG: hypothetical protein C6499_19130 [Candidatus Poribacteria bacterium]